MPMAAADMQTLLGGVRRRLWRAQFTAAVRRAAWGSACLMLLGVAVHLIAFPLPVAALAWAVAVPWAATIAWAAWRRPADPACALWADRRLGGASAYTTWLEVRAGQHGTADAAAVRGFEQWALARVPDSLRRLAAMPAPAQLARPLVSMAVCTALATLVLALPQATRSSRPPLEAAAGSAVSGDRPLAAAPAAPALVNEIAQAMRAPDAPDTAQRGGARRQAATNPGPGDESQQPPALPDGSAGAGARAATAQTSSGPSVAVGPSSGGELATGAGGGREAGDSPDQRADGGVSHALRGTITVQRSALGARGTVGGWQADIDRSATYGEEPSRPGTAAPQSGPAPAAATPPAATDATQLTPTETSYIQAWMKASGRRR